MIAKLGVNSDLVVGLPLDECLIINLDETGQETMTVTLVDANHCPGSVMFIFEGYFGKILYTGDCRFCDRFTSHSAIQGKLFDILYLDNTYCDPKCFFPSRTQATVNIMKIIRSHPECKVVIGLHNLGKEMLLHSIAVVLKTWIGVDPVRKETLELLEMPNVFTCEVDKVWIRVVKSNEITKKNIQHWNSNEPTIAILPTCLYIGATNPYANVENVFVVPYSDHSSFEELRKFVQSVKPRKIIPIVHKHRLSPGETINSRVNMNVFQSLMDSSPSSQYTVPRSVECFMTAEIQRATKQRVKATGKLCMRKTAKIKKPCGVVFPPDPETTETETDKSDVDVNKLDRKSTVCKGTGDKEHGQEITKRNAVTSSSIKCGLADSESRGKANVGSDSGEKDHTMVQRITEDETNTVASSSSIKCVTAVSESGGMSNMGIESGEKDHDIAQQTFGDELNSIGSSSIESGLVGSVSDNEDIQDNSMVQEIAGDEIDSSSIKSGLTGSESRETPKALNNVGDKELVTQRNIHVGDKDGETAVASSIKTNGMCDENVISPNVNLPIRDHREDEASGVASSCIKTKDVRNNVIIPIRKENNPLKRKYNSELCDNNDSDNDNGDSDNGVDKQSLSKKKFNIYTGCSCDFARKVVEDMVKNGEFRDK